MPITRIRGDPLAATAVAAWAEAGVRVIASRSDSAARGTAAVASDVATGGNVIGRSAGTGPPVGESAGQRSDAQAGPGGWGSERLPSP